MIMPENYFLTSKFSSSCSTELLEKLRSRMKITGKTQKESLETALRLYLRSDPNIEKQSEQKGQETAFTVLIQSLEASPSKDLPM